MPIPNLYKAAPVTRQSFGSNVEIPDMTLVSNQRNMNHLNTSTQLQNYAAAKSMAEQGRSDMRGNVSGYSDTLG